MPSDKNFDSVTIPQKYFDKIVKMQQDQDKARIEEYEILRQHLAQMNILLEQLIKVSESGSTIAASKKIIPFHTGSQEVGQLNEPPPNPDDYPTRIDVYSINSNRVIPHMTLINDGPGEIFFINAYAKNVFNEKEAHLNVNDQRELFNVFEIRLRSTLPLTTIRLIEGIFRTGSTAPQTRINVEIRPTIQANQLLKDFSIVLDNFTPITITVPTVQTFPIDNTPFGLALQPPLPPGATATLVDFVTGIPMPFTIPEGFGIEQFAIFANMSTDFTLRSFFEAVPGFFSENALYPVSNRPEVPFAQSQNLSFFSTSAPFPFGVPAGGFRVLVTVTNDDPFNNMIGSIDLIAILSRLS